AVTHFRLRQRVCSFRLHSSLQSSGPAMVAPLVRRQRFAALPACYWRRVLNVSAAHTQVRSIAPSALCADRRPCTARGAQVRNYKPWPLIRVVAHMTAAPGPGALIFGQRPESGKAVLGVGAVPIPQCRVVSCSTGAACCIAQRPTPRTQRRIGDAIRRRLFICLRSRLSCAYKFGDSFAPQAGRRTRGRPLAHRTWWNPGCRRFGFKHDLNRLGHAWFLGRLFSFVNDLWHRAGKSRFRVDRELLAVVIRPGGLRHSESLPRFPLLPLGGRRLGHRRRLSTEKDQQLRFPLPNCLDLSSGKLACGNNADALSADVQTKALTGQLGEQLGRCHITTLSCPPLVETAAFFCRPLA